MAGTEGSCLLKGAHSRSHPAPPRMCHQAQQVQRKQSELKAEGRLLSGCWGDPEICPLQDRKLRPVSLVSSILQSQPELQTGSLSAHHTCTICAKCPMPK